MFYREGDKIFYGFNDISEYFYKFLLNINFNYPEYLEFKKNNKSFHISIASQMLWDYFEKFVQKYDKKYKKTIRINKNSFKYKFGLISESIKDFLLIIYINIKIALLNLFIKDNNSSNFLDEENIFSIKNGKIYLYNNDVTTQFYDFLLSLENEKDKTFDFIYSGNLFHLGIIDSKEVEEIVKIYK